VDHAAGLRVPSAVGHVEGIHDEFRAVVIGHGITDDLAGGQVQPAGEVEPALGGGQVGDVADQLDPGPLGVKVAADQVRGRLRLLVGPGQRAALAPGDASDVALAHHAGDALAVHPPPQTPQFGVDARDAVGAAGGDVQHRDLVRERVVGGLPGLVLQPDFCISPGQRSGGGECSGGWACAGRSWAGRPTNVCPRRM
jgi:hypothetical protein